MAIQGNKNAPADGIRSDLVRHLSSIRQEIGALRQELSAPDQSKLSLAEDSYRLATQIDLMVNRYLRLIGREGDHGPARDGI